MFLHWWPLAGVQSSDTSDHCDVTTSIPSETDHCVTGRKFLQNILQTSSRHTARNKKTLAFHNFLDPKLSPTIDWLASGRSKGVIDVTIYDVSRASVVCESVWICVKTLQFFSQFFWNYDDVIHRMTECGFPNDKPWIAKRSFCSGNEIIHVIAFLLRF